MATIKTNSPNRHMAQEQHVGQRDAIRVFKVVLIDNINWFLWKCTMWHLSLAIKAGQRGTPERERIVYPWTILYAILFCVIMKTDQGQCWGFSGYLTRLWQQLSDCHAPGQPYFRFVLATVRQFGKTNPQRCNSQSRRQSFFPTSLLFPYELFAFKEGCILFSYFSYNCDRHVTPTHTHTHTPM